MKPLPKMWFEAILCICIWMTWCPIAAHSIQNPIVKTSLGPIQGKLLQMEEANDITNDVYEFIGIPFAQPPVGELRFKKPQPIEAWTGIFQATKWSDICVQSIKLTEFYNITAGGVPSEDCLYLNVWTPELPNEDSNPKRAVMLFIHGGGYKAGSASQPFYNGRYIASLGDVVVVTINYRVGILGFLNLGVEDAPGNQGFWDQRLALLWVKEHIENFGGDPEQITVFGESAGSMSIGVHLLSPMSQGLFQHAIMQSGSPLHVMILDTPEVAVNTTLAFSQRGGCLEHEEISVNETSNVLSCLKQIDVSHIIQQEDKFAEDMTKSFFNPTYGDEFFPRVEDFHAFEDHTAVDLLIGVNANEGSLFLLRPLMEIEAGKNGSKDFTLGDAIALAEKLMAKAGKSVTHHAVRLYFEQTPPDASAHMLKQLTGHVVGDYFLACPAVHFAHHFALHNPVYFYHFNHRQSNSPMEEWMGVTHAQELPYIFQIPIIGEIEDTEKERTCAREMLNLWTTFAKTGKPQVPGIDTWPLYSEDNPVYVDLKPNNYTTGIGPRVRACNFWKCHHKLP